MEIDQNKFMNLIVESTTKKMNALQGQVIVLEAQLACAIELNSSLQAELDKLKKTDNKKSEYKAP